MKSVERLIGDLLLRHNCVIIPTFGGFVAKPISAKLDYNKGVMMPPSKSLLFNKQLVNNDGLLLNEYTQANQVSFDEATQALAEKLDEWASQLKKGTRVEIDRVGHLYYDEEHNICFEQDRFFNLLLESFGLSAVHFLSEEDVFILEKKMEVETPVVEPIAIPVEKKKVISIVAEQSEPDTTPEAVKPEKKEKEIIEHPETRKRKAWKYIAAACLLPIAFYSVWIPVKTDVLESGVLSIKDFNPFYQSSDGSYLKKEFDKNLELSLNEEKSLEEEINELQTEESHYTFKFDEETFMKVRIPVDDELANESEELNSNNTTSAAPIQLNEMNHIVGCFANKENAVNLVAKLKSNRFDARIYDTKNGLYRVTAGSAVSNENYDQIKANADAIGLSGWKLK